MTKVNKSKENDEIKLKNFIKKSIHKICPAGWDFPLRFYRLLYDNDLEDADANELKNYIAEEKYPLKSYRNLMQEIISIAGLDNRLDTYIARDEWEKIIEEIKNIPLDKGMYISRRFINENIKQYIQEAAAILLKTICTNIIIDKLKLCQLRNLLSKEFNIKNFIAGNNIRLEH